MTKTNSLKMTSEKVNDTKEGFSKWENSGLKYLVHTRISPTVLEPSMLFITIIRLQLHFFLNRVSQASSFLQILLLKIGNILKNYLIRNPN